MRNLMSDVAVLPGWRGEWAVDNRVATPGQAEGTSREGTGLNFFKLLQLATVDKFGCGVHDVAKVLGKIDGVDTVCRLQSELLP